MKEASIFWCGSEWTGVCCTAALNWSPILARFFFSFLTCSHWWDEQVCSETNGLWRFGPFLRARPIFRPFSVVLRWGGRNKRTKERYGELGKPLKLCLNYTFLALPVLGDAAICVFFYSAWLARSQAELNACLWPQEDDASVSLCQPGGP